MTTREHLEKDVIPFFNLKEYFDNGYKGQGIIVATMESTTDGHGSMVADTIMTYAPNCKLISFNDEHDISAMSDVDGNVAFPTFVEWCIANNVDIVTSSLDWSCQDEREQEAIKKLYEHGIIFCNCAGNSGKEIKHDEINKTWDFDKEVLTISGIMYDTKGKITWSNFNYGEAVDLCGIGSACPVYSRDDKSISYAWSGTSSATPMVAGMLATYKSYDKTLNSKNVFEKIVDKMTTICEYKGFKHKILILPKIENISDQSEVIMEDNQNNWKLEFDEVWERATKLKVVDGTRPNDNVTRNELVVILDRLGLLK